MRLTYRQITTGVQQKKRFRFPAIRGGLILVGLLLALQPPVMAGAAELPQPSSLEQLVQAAQAARPQPSGGKTQPMYSLGTVVAGQPQTSVQLAGVRQEGDSYIVALDVTLANASAVWGLEFTMTYDPTALAPATRNAVNYVEVNSSYMDTFILQNNDKPGTWVVGAATVDPWSGVLFGLTPVQVETFYFRVLQPGQTAVQVTLTDMVTTSSGGLDAGIPGQGTALFSAGLPVVISAVTPLPGTDVTATRPAIAFKAASSFGMEQGSGAAQVQLDGVELAPVPSKVPVDSVIAVASNPLTSGTHQVAVAITDQAGHPGNAGWDFAISGNDSEVSFIQVPVLEPAAGSFSRTRPLQAGLAAEAVNWEIEVTPPAGHPLIPGVSGSFTAEGLEFDFDWPSPGAVVMPDGEYAIQATAWDAKGNSREFNWDQVTVYDHPLQITSLSLLSSGGVTKTSFNRGERMVVEANIYNLETVPVAGRAIVLARGPDSAVWISREAQINLTIAGQNQLNLELPIDSGLPPGAYNICLMLWSASLTGGGMPLAVPVNASVTIT